MTLLVAIVQIASPSTLDGLAMDQVDGNDEQSAANHHSKLEQAHHSVPKSGARSYWTIRIGPSSVSLITSVTDFGRASSHKDAI
ncbi:hypothetical protein, partial [Xanthomonas perforans]|uniref:hypothetical protein n=1 Tax=Xanthomonas perforans TaxID=442694 RepID=UPI001F1E9CF7